MRRRARARAAATGIVEAGEQRGLAAVAAEPVGSGEHEFRRRRGNLVGERSWVDDDGGGRVDSGQPCADRGPVRRIHQAVAGDVDDVVRGRLQRVEVVGAERGLGSRAGDEGTLAFRVDQTGHEAGVQVGARRQQDLDALRAQCGSRPVAEGAGAVRPGVDDGGALAGGRGHHVVAAAGGGRRAPGKHVAAALGKVGDFEDDVDDGVAGVQETAGHDRLAGSLNASPSAPAVGRRRRPGRGG